MKRRGLLTAVIALVLASGHASAADPDGLAEAVKRVQERYETTRTLTAEFKQIVESPTLAGSLESHGTLAFEKPNRMRWDYAPPDKQVIVGDGETLWIYQPDERQVIKAPLGEAFQASTPISFLAGLGRLDRDFATSLEREDAERWVLRLVPRKDEGLGTLTLVVRKPDATVEEARVTDALGTTTRLRLSAEKRNERLDPGLFRFTPPAGVDVVRPPAY
jgi:outer membrane lipoprotein carrier protein